MNTTVLALQEEQVLVAALASPALSPSVQALYSAPVHGAGMENWEKAIGALGSSTGCPTRRHHARPCPG